MDNLLYDLEVVPMFRYSYRSDIPKNLSWYEATFPGYDDNRFRKLVRCSRVQFECILNEIKSNIVFNGHNSELQFTVEFQLAMVLYRLGSYGEGATIQKMSCLFGVGDGGTINKVTTRVFEAILSLEEKYLTWPNEDERVELVQNTIHELPHCVAYTDGTEIKLAEAPTLDRDSFLSRNKIFALKLQGTIDHKKRFRHINIGYPGSVHDARIFNECVLATDPSSYLTEPQWMAADSAYKLRTTVITPFRKNSKQLNATSRNSFNRYFSSFRVRVEHAFGIMKEKFPSCKELPIRIIDAKSHKFACTWIRVCCILHNMLLPLYNEEDLSHSFESTNTSDDRYDSSDDEEDMAQLKRNALVEVLLTEKW